MFCQILAVVLLVAGVRSQGAVSYTLNHDGTTNLEAKVPLMGNDRNLLSAVGSGSSTGVIGKGLALENVNGHGLSLQHNSIPGFGNQLTGAGRLNLLDTNHRLDANAFVTRNMPNIPQVPNFNTVGGNLDYMYKNNIGASLGARHTPFLQRTDYSALGKVNVFRSPTSSLDLNAGVSRSISPQFKTNWQPTGGFSFTKFFGKY